MSGTGPAQNPLRMMGVLNFMDSGFNPRDPFPSTLLEENQRRYAHEELNGIQAGEVSRTWGHFHLAAHGTTLERACQIIRRGELLSFEQLKSARSSIVANNMALLTDVLDMELGLHRHVFLNLGRVHPLDIHPVYFLFPNKLLQEEGAVVALREITHFGALVSWEAVEACRQHTPFFRVDQAPRRNADAAKSFFSNVFGGDGFRDQVFPGFLEKNYRNIAHYTSSLEYPGTKVTLERRGHEATLRNIWEGPQVMIPDRISLGKFSPAVLITDTRRDKVAQRALEAAGFPKERIFSMSEVVPLYKNKFSRLGDYNQPLNRGTYVNMALRDIALLAEYNQANQNYSDGMNGFTNRIK